MLRFLAPQSRTGPRGRWNVISSSPNYKYYQFKQQQQQRPFFWNGGGQNGSSDDSNNEDDPDTTTAKNESKRTNTGMNEKLEVTIRDKKDSSSPIHTSSTTSSRKKGNRNNANNKNGNAGRLLPISNPFEKKKMPITNYLWGASGYDSDVSSGGGSVVGGGSSGGSGIMKLSYGDEAPRYPHLIGLPVINRPIFPGIISTVNVSDPTTIAALENAKSSAGYVGVFLRKNGSSGVTEGGVILDEPELITDPNDLYKVGTFAQIHRINRGPSHHSKSHDQDGVDIENHPNDGPISVLLLAHRRIDLVSVDNIGPPIDVTVSHWDRLEYNATADSKAHDTIRALSNEIVSTIREVAQISPLFREHIHVFPTRVDANDPYRFADFTAGIATATPEELQGVLEEKDVEQRLHKALVIMKKEREVSKLQQEISAKVEEKMSESQRKYFLMEQLKSIKKELGMEQDDKEALLEKYRKKLKEFKDNIPEEVETVINSELEKLSTLEKNSSEFNVTRSYLDWLTDIPWGNNTEENFDISEARTILDRDHYGLDDVKDIILQFIAVGKLKGTVQGKILCLAGPPGVGKTSIASSVAEALNRNFFRVSVGGLSDVSEIKGHRRTYVGAMPGKMIQCLKSVGSVNPLILIDEIDKLGRDFRGDPASALLEVLDPSQNSTFRDHFLDVAVDMSKVLFMCTANDISTIPGPLLDRMEIIQLSGYDVPDKIAIAEQYLIPKSMLDNGLKVEEKEDEEDEEKEEDDKGEAAEIIEESTQTDKKVKKSTRPSSKKKYKYGENVPESVSLERSAVESLVRWYCREAGVRNLAKHVDKITRKLALQVVAENEQTKLSDKTGRKGDTWAVTESNLEDYVGKPLFTSDRMYEKDPLPNGIVMGLAWTSMGGSALYIETQGIQRGTDKEGKPRGGGNLKVTGQLGSVMNESTQIAYTVSRAQLAQLQPNNDYYDENDIHMHVPEGATPKDGPSAGITMVTAMLSLAMDQPIKHDLAMTGEVSLTGKVLPVGGIKEKTMAAKRAGIKSIIFPIGNKKDFDDIPEYLKEELDVHFAEEYRDVFKVAFEGSKP